MWSVLARHRYRRVSLSCSTPRRFRARYVVCLSTSSPLSLVIDGFDTLPRSMRGLDSHVIAIIAWYCPVASPVITTIAVDIVHTNYPRIRPAIAPDVWSVLPRYRYRRLSLTCSIRCRAHCVVLVRASSLSLHGVVRSPVLSLLLSPWTLFTPISPGLGPRSHPMCCLCYHGIAIVACH